MELQALKERAEKLYEDIKMSTHWDINQLFTGTEKKEMEAYEKKNGKDYDGQKKTFKDARKGNKVAQNVIFSKLQRQITQLFFKNFLGHNKEMGYRKHDGESAFGTFIAMAYDGMINGYTEKSADERETKTYAGKAITYSPLDTFRPEIFDKNPTDLYEKFGYTYYQYMKQYIIFSNNKMANSGITKVPGANYKAIHTSDYETTILAGEEAGVTYDNPTYKSVELTVDEEAMLDNLRQITKDPDFIKKTGKGDESGSLKDILKVLIKMDTASGNKERTMTDLNSEIYEKLNMKRGTFMLRVKDLKEFLDDYEIDMSLLMQFISTNGPRKILAILR